MRIATSSTEVAVLGVGIEVCPLTGCDGTPTMVYSPRDTDVRLLLEGGCVYWTSGVDARIYRCPITGCADVPEVVVAGHSLWESPIFVAANELYWWTDDVPQHTPLNGGAPSQPAFSQLVGASLPQTGAVDGKLAIVGRIAYFVENVSHAVVRCSLPDCADPVEIATTNTDKLDLHADERDIFWLEFDQSLHTCSVDGCLDGPKLVTPHPVFAYTFDETDVYGPSGWTPLPGNARCCRRPAYTAVSVAAFNAPRAEPKLAKFIQTASRYAPG